MRRPRGPDAELARETLLRLERAGFDASPRWLGADDEGRDILSWIEGHTFTERGRMHPFVGDPELKVTFSDEQLRAVFRLLRHYHEALADDPICHGDFGPWNLVWREAVPVGVIDFDDLHRGEPAEDVAYALRMFVGYGLAAAEPEELVRRTRAALAAYGRKLDAAAILEREYDLAEERCRRNGWHRQLAKLPLEREWLERHRDRL